MMFTSSSDCHHTRDHPYFIYIGFRLDHSLMLCICFCFCKAPYLKKMDVFDLPLQIILWFQFGIVGLFFDIT